MPVTLLLKSTKQAIVFGFLTWLIPFVVSLFFVNRGEYLIPETFFKTIMVVVGGVTGVVLSVTYFKKIEASFFSESLKLGLLWLIINWLLDLILVRAGLFNMSVWQYFTDIGFRYLNIPVFLIGMGYILHCKQQK